MKLRGQPLGIEIRKDGVYACFGEKKVRFESLQELKESYRGYNIGVAIGRDMLLVRKYRLPKEAIENLQEAVLLNIEEVFPTKADLKVIVDKLGYRDDGIECLIYALPQSFYDDVLSVKRVKFLVPSPLLYKFLERDKVVRKLEDGLYERTTIEHGKVKDTVILEDLSIADKQQALQDDFALACKALDILLKREALELSFYDERKFLPVRVTKRHVYALALSILILFVSFGVMLFDLYKIKSKLSRATKEIEKLKPLAERYENKLRDVERKRMVISLLQSKGFMDEFAPLVEYIPKNTKLLSVHYDQQGILLEGYTPSSTSLMDSLKSKYKDVQQQTPDFKPPSGQGFKVLIRF
ncbi:MAG: hypothetical protein ACK4SM_02990 [Aquificaceae bacterium]